MRDADGAIFFRFSLAPRSHHVPLQKNKVFISLQQRNSYTEKKPL